MFELLDTSPVLEVQDAEYRRLLGYPADHVPGDRALELAAGARRFFAEQGRPWIYVREAALVLEHGKLSIDGVEFPSESLRQHLAEAGAKRLLLVAVSAGSACERRARELWEQGRPDEYFFLEMFGSAVVEQLVSATNGRLCGWAESDGWSALPHFSPGYTGWDVADQPRLFQLITQRMSRPMPEPMVVLSSGMLRPKKSLLAVVGLAPRTARVAGPRRLPCESCAFSPCQFRRAPYSKPPDQIESVAQVSGMLTQVLAQAVPATPAERTTRFPLSRNAQYSVSQKALQKWVRERVRLDRQDDGSVRARFRFDGTTCSNQGRPLAFDYTVALSRPADGFRILEADCRPAEGDDGHQAMCEFLRDATGLMQAIADEKPLLGQPLDEVLNWKRAAAPSGCYCDAPGRTHKWGLALEAIHCALVEAAPERELT